MRILPRPFVLAAALLVIPFTGLGCATPAPKAPNATAAEAHAPAQTPASAPDRVLQPLLWRVSGKDLKASSYLFGTIHLSDERIIRMHPLSRAAFRKSASLHTEIDMDPEKEKESAKAMLRKDGKSLSAHIGPELAKRLDAELKAINPAMSPFLFAPLKTWAVAIALPTLEDQLKGGRPLDAQLWEQAKAAGKRCGALESTMDHIGGLDTLSDDEQKLLLSSSLKALAEERAGKAKITKADLVTLYLRGDDAGLARLQKEEANDPDASAEEKALSDKLEKLLMADRNPIMAKVIVGELRDHPGESHFFAAGSAHFVGENNVGDLLKKAGYRVERVVEKPKPAGK